MSELSAAELPKSFETVKGLKMAYSELGEGDPVLFLHGNPTSSYLWRNIMPHVAGNAHTIAADLIGMGDSDKLPNPGPSSYRFVEHRKYLNAFIDQIIPQGKITLVIHDWGSALGFDWANRNRDRVRGICYMEGIVAPVSINDFPEITQPVFRGFRSEAGESMILEKNIFIERVLPGSILRDLGTEEMDVYRRPFLEAGENRRPTLTWPRQIPFDGEPADVHNIVSDYAAWMAQNDLPKLFINAEPGAILGGKQREFCRTWKNQTEVTVKGSHFIQEDSPHEIGIALNNWYQGIK